MNTLHTWLTKERGRTSLLARHLGLSQPFVHKMGSGAKPIPVVHGAAIEQFTGGEVTRKDLFPDWPRIWPELATATTNSEQKPHPALDGQVVGAMAD